MNDFNKISTDDLRILITNTANDKGLSNAVVEKDYWVSYMLHYLFNHTTWKNIFVFKGGTSLSKCFQLIERFSEDIDLILDWTVLGYGAKEPWIERSNKKQDRFNREVNEKTKEYLINNFLQIITPDFEENLKSEFSFSIDEENEQTVLFKYPKLFISDYLDQSVRLEIGALAIMEPWIDKEIKPLIGEKYPNIFTSQTKVKTIVPERTFWEKVTILHHEANRPEEKSMPLRYSRHYYDLYKMANSDIKDAAKSKHDLLKSVVASKMKFYPRAWAKYEDTLESGIKLLPNEVRLAEISKDYDSMKEMFYGNFPSFEDLINTIKNLEDELNQ